MACNGRMFSFWGGWVTFCIAFALSRCFLRFTWVNFEGWNSWTPNFWVRSGDVLHKYAHGNEYEIQTSGFGKELSSLYSCYSGSPTTFKGWEGVGLVHRYSDNSDEICKSLTTSKRMSVLLYSSWICLLKPTLLPYYLSISKCLPDPFWVMRILQIQVSFLDLVLV